MNCPARTPIRRTSCRVTGVQGARSVRPTMRGYRQSRIFSLWSGALYLSLDLCGHRGLHFHLYLTNNQKKTRDKHDHTKVPYMKRYTLYTDESEYMQPKELRSGGPIVSTDLTDTYLIRVRPTAPAGYSPTSPPPALAQGILLQNMCGLAHAGRAGSQHRGTPDRLHALHETESGGRVEWVGLEQE